MNRLAVIAVIALSAFVARGADSKLVLTDFETDADKKFEQGEIVKIVAENPKTGAHSLRILGGDGYPGLGFDDGQTLRKFGEFNTFRVDIFNPQPETVIFTASAGDGKSKDYGTRYNNDN